MAFRNVFSSGNLAFFNQRVGCLTTLWREVAINNLWLSRVFKLQRLQHSVSLAGESNACNQCEVSESGEFFHCSHISVQEHFHISVAILSNSSIYRCLLEAHNSDLD